MKRRHESSSSDYSRSSRDRDSKRSKTNDYHARDHHHHHSSSHSHHGSSSRSSNSHSGSSSHGSSSSSSHHSSSNSSHRHSSTENSHRENLNHSPEPQPPIQTTPKPSSFNFENMKDVVVQVAGTNPPKPCFEFTDVNFSATLLDNIKYAGFLKPTPVQQYSIPIMLAGRDMMATAQTGSGKTAAFLFPVIEFLMRDEGNRTNRHSSSSSRIYPRALILPPTRELASQIYEEALKFIYRTGLKAGVCYGGASFWKQAGDLQRGCDILCATPGRLVDMIDRGKVSLSDIQFLVFDEADRMLDMGFEPQIRQIVEQRDMPSTSQRHTCMFSATFPKEIQKLASDFLKDYVFLQVGSVGKTVESIKQVIKYVDDKDKRDKVLSELSSVNGLTLIFVERKKDCNYLGKTLEHRGFQVSTIHGDRTQHERESALTNFRLGKTRILVATSVAARGLDIPDVAHVINFDLPGNIEDYVHRIGRTGRCGKAGLATAFYNNDANINIARELVGKLQESKQEVPSFLFQAASRPKKQKRSYGRYEKNASSSTGSLPTSFARTTPTASPAFPPKPVSNPNTFQTKLPSKPSATPYLPPATAKSAPLIKASSSFSHHYPSYPTPSGTSTYPPPMPLPPKHAFPYPYSQYSHDPYQGGFPGFSGPQNYYPNPINTTLSNFDNNNRYSGGYVGQYPSAPYPHAFSGPSGNSVNGYDPSKPTGGY